MALLDDIINSGTIGDSLDLGAKYAAERARMSAGEKRIADANSNLRNMQLPDFQKAGLSEAGKVMASAMNTSEAEPMLDEARRGLLGFLDAARTRGQRRQLAKGLRAQGSALGKILSADRSARLAAAGAVSPEMQAVGKENRALDRERKMFDFKKDRQIEALDDQLTRLEGAYGDTQGKMGRDVLKMIRENPELANIFKRGTSLGDEGKKPDKASKLDKKIARSISKIQDIEQDDDSGIEDTLDFRLKNIDQPEEVFEDDLDFPSLLKNSKKRPGQFKDLFSYIQQLRG